ncbi:MAG TPA: PASTA domain-containing protein, partial [Gaiellaceae bacterium]|nr:PASTA domain-containing protein [Gaiellaceae bacterium]
EEVYEEHGGQDRPLWPWLVAVGFVIAAIIAGFFVWQELSGTPQVVVNNYVGESQKNAEQQITAANLHAAVNRVSNEKVDRGKVFKQDPEAGSKIDKNGTVTIWVSTGPPKVSVPDVKGQSWPTAQQTLVNLGLKPERHIVPGDTKDQVTATDPAAGESVPKGSKIRVNVMSGPATGTVPSVVGLSLQEAISKLNKAGFNANPKYVNNSTAPANQVISQSPVPGSSETKGTSVTVEVSNGPPQATVPDVVGFTSQQAVQTLQADGFKVNQQYQNTGADQDNVVQSQNPPGNSTATKGDVVTIVIGQHSPGPPPPPTTTTTTTTP